MKRALVLAAIAGAACAPAPIPPATGPAASDTAPPAASSAPAASSPPEVAPVLVRFDQIARLRFNQLAAELALPLFWITDEKTPGAIDPEELAVLWGVTPRSAAWIEGGTFTPAFAAAYTAMVKVNADGHPTAGLDEAEKRRRAAVVAELAQGLPTLVRSSFVSASAEDKALVGHIVAAAEIIERLYKRQLGTLGIEAEIPAGDTASQMLFYRNQGPFCVAPGTEKDPSCRGIPRALPRLSGLYPASLLKEPKFCDALEARPDQKELLSPFTVVSEEGGGLKPVPYNVAFKDEMTAVSRELAAAAETIKSPGEAPFKAYLTAASRSFLDNNWDPADEAWSKMSAENSKWYLRIGPDEVYGDPCNRKAGFHVSFARINQASLAWQRKLDPVKNAMEAELAKLAGAPYKARKVAFRLPDFIDVVLNAGDSRDPLGATGGQSLPNWGPVAADGRGRTVAMVNLYTDDDSQRVYHAKVESLVCKASFDPASLEHDLQIASTVLHEAAHNLGPSHEYEVKKKTDADIFGGSLASLFEELKAQTSAMYLSHWLAGRGLIEKKMVGLEHASDVYWAFGQISQGMFDADGKPNTYPSLASIQIGSLLAAGAMAWKPDEMAVNGADKGCFELRLKKFPKAIAALEKKVLGIKGRGDKAGAAALRQAYVDKDGEWKRLRGVIAERWLRAPRASFVYAIEL